MRKILFVVNPVAGKGNGKILIPIIKERFADYDYDIIISTKKSIITELVEKKINEKNYSDIIAAGGDGTLTEVINGVNGHNIAIGLLPIGSGNDFAKTLNIGNNIDNAIDIIKGGIHRKVYTCSINDITFINVVGIGIDAEILNYKDNSKILKGKMNYLVSTLRGIINYSPTKKDIYIDDKLISKNTLFIAIGNGKYIGSGMKITPFANTESKDFNICTIGNLKKHILIKSLTKLYKGLHGEVDGVDMYFGKDIKIEFESEIPVDVDGSLMKFKKVHLKKNDTMINFLVKEK
ncbi:diacylglycerol kinase family lipid kinase [Clostridiaceae bacterium HSG29]|nr:diacylglycerol kinase family lipid kinase [Clostridiaceae bacterium HSG29]